MSIIDPIERYIKRYDYLIKKRNKLEENGHDLSKEEEEELEFLKPNITTPIILLFEILTDAISEFKTKGNHHNDNHNHNHIHNHNHESKQKGGAETEVQSAPGEPGQAREADPTIPLPQGQQMSREEIEYSINNIHELLAPLVAQLIASIEKKKKDAKDEDKKKYPDVGTAIINTFTLALQKIKDLFTSGSDDTSKSIFDKIDPKKMMPGFPENPEAANEIITELENGIHEPMDRFKKTIATDVRDIADSSVSGILNAISLIPGIGTTLQLWRLLQNALVIVSKTTGTLASGQGAAIDVKKNMQNVAQRVKDRVEAAVENAATQAVEGATQSVVNNANNAVAGAVGGVVAQPLPTMPLNLPASVSKAVSQAVSQAAPPAAAAAHPSVTVQKPQGGGSESSGAPKKHTTKKLWSAKKYKKEYNKSVREMKRTKKRFMNYLKRII